MVDICVSPKLLLPDYFYIDSERAPAPLSDFYFLVCRKNNCIWMESWMQIYFYSICILIKGCFSLCWLYIKTPFIFVYRYFIINICCVTYSYFVYNSISKRFRPFFDLIWVMLCDLFLQIRLWNDISGVKDSSAERTFFNVCVLSSLIYAGLTENMPAFPDGDRLVVDGQANCTSMTFLYLSLHLVFIASQLIINLSLII